MANIQKHAGLMQYAPSGIDFASAKVKNGRNGVVRRASLDFDVFTIRTKINGGHWR